MIAHGPMNFRKFKSQRKVSNEKILSIDKRITESCNRVIQYGGSGALHERPHSRASSALHGGSSIGTSRRSGTPLDLLLLDAEDADSVRAMHQHRQRLTAEQREIAAQASISREVYTYSQTRFNRAISTMQQQNQSTQNATKVEKSPFLREASFISSKSDLSPYVLQMPKSAEPDPLNQRRQQESCGELSLRRAKTTLPSQRLLSHPCRQQLMNQIRLHQHKTPMQFYHDRIAQEYIVEGARPSKTLLMPTRWASHYYWDAIAQPHLVDLAVTLKCAERTRQPGDWLEKSEAEEECGEEERIGEEEMLVMGEGGEEEMGEEAFEEEERAHRLKTEAVGEEIEEEEVDKRKKKKKK